MSGKHTPLKNEKITLLEIPIERHPTNDFFENFSVSFLNKRQIDILVKDQDIRIGAGDFYLPGNEKVRFSISKRLYEIFNSIFDWYAELGINEFKEMINNRMNDFPWKIGKSEYLKNKRLDEIILFDKLPKQELFKSASGHYWFDLIENDHLLRLIKYFKFDILKGERIPNNFPGIDDFYLFESFFISENLKIAYEGMRINKRISFLNSISGLNDFENKKPTHRLSAIIYKYKEDAGYEKPLSRITMANTWGKNREKAFDTIGYFNGAKKGKTYKAISIEELSEAILFLSEFPNAEKKAKNDLENLINS